MTDLVYDFITTGVDMVISAAILSSIVVMLYTSSALSVEITNSQATSETLRYYAKFNQYDNEAVSASDAIGAIIRYADDMPVVVMNDTGVRIVSTTGDGRVFYYDSTTGTDIEIDKSVATLVNYVTEMADMVWVATLETDGSSAGGIGVVQGIKFQLKAANSI